MRVLGREAGWTASTHASGGHGRLTVKYHGKPAPEEIGAIERLVNEAVEKGLPLEVLVLPRSVAEERFGDEIYGLSPARATCKS